MAHDIAQSLAKSKRGLVIGPAGCGKTRLIAEAVNGDKDRQLVLTHTHAGVRAILNHLKTFGVSVSRVRVTTIDSFALRYVLAFPNLSNWNIREPTDDQWRDVHGAAERAFQCRAVRRVLQATYRGIYVDEYQDCSSSQHALLTNLCHILPCRILGDPLQAIFYEVHKDNVMNWALAEAEFEKIGELSVPYRWRGRNEELGQWILDVRKRLETGEEIDLKQPCFMLRTDTRDAKQVAVCKTLLGKRGESVVGIRKWRPQCYRLAGYLGNAYVSMETVECQDLEDWCERIEDSFGAARLETVAEFAKTCLSRLGSDICAYPQKIQLRKRIDSRKDDRKALLSCMCEVTQDSDLCAVDRLLDAYTSLQERPVFKRRELWSEMKRVIRQHKGKTTKRMRETAWNRRETARRIGRNIPHRCLSTTLLVKGLEFDHAAVLNLNEFGDAENAYVAITRGARSLTILSRSSKVRFQKPQYSE